MWISHNPVWLRALSLTRFRLPTVWIVPSGPVSCVELWDTPIIRDIWLRPQTTGLMKRWAKLANKWQSTRVAFNFMCIELCSFERVIDKKASWLLVLWLYIFSCLWGFVEWRLHQFQWCTRSHWRQIYPAGRGRSLLCQDFWLSVVLSPDEQTNK